MARDMHPQTAALPCERLDCWIAWPMLMSFPNYLISQLQFSSDHILSHTHTCFVLEVTDVVVLVYPNFDSSVAGNETTGWRLDTIRKVYVTKVKITQPGLTGSDKGPTQPRKIGLFKGYQATRMKCEWYVV